MGEPKIVVVDYHKGNLSSVARGLARAGAAACTSDDPEQIRNADGLVIPGVGAFYDAIAFMRQSGEADAVLDAVAAGEPVDPVWRDEVEHVSHRRYSTGFFFGQPGQYTESSRYIRDWQVCAIVTDCTPDGLATLSLRNKFAAGDVGPDTRPFSVTVPVMQDADGLPLREPRTPQMVFRMQLPRPVPAMSIVRRAVDLSAK